MLKPIPIKTDPKEYAFIQPEKCKFVRVISDDKINVQMQYPLLGYTNTVEDCYVRKTVYEKLLIAQSLLPEGYKIRIWDAWRPFSLQKELYEKYFHILVKNFSLDNLMLEQQQKIVSKYVSLPEYNRLQPPFHTTGGAVDVTLIDRANQEVDMGTKFDDFSDKSHTCYYETNSQDFEIRDNRRLLYNCMISAGFENLPSEWWHYSYGDKAWAYYNDTPALYDGVFTIREIKNEK